jgi:hypothetical protein
VDQVTDRLVSDHPLTKEFTEVVLASWSDIFATRVGGQKYRIGADIKPSAQLVGLLFHELVPLAFQGRYPGRWSKATNKRDKDLVCLVDPVQSVEIKSSSHSSQIFGNRSYAQIAAEPESAARKGKSGYYLAINFEKFSADTHPRIVKIRFGWLYHNDWIAQRSPTGQQARVNPFADRVKLVRLYP